MENKTPARVLSQTSDSLEQRLGAAERRRPGRSRYNLSHDLGHRCHGVHRARPHASPDGVGPRAAGADPSIPTVAAPSQGTAAGRGGREPCRRKRHPFRAARGGGDLPSGRRGVAGTQCKSADRGHAGHREPGARGSRCRREAHHYGQSPWSQPRLGLSRLQGQGCGRGAHPAFGSAAHHLPQRDGFRSGRPLHHRPGQCAAGFRPSSFHCPAARGRLCSRCGWRTWSPS